MTEQKFKELVEKTLHVLEGYAIDENGNKKIHIVGIEKLYKQLTLTAVSHRRELLKGFANYLQSDVGNLNYDFTELVDDYEKTL